MIIKSHKSYVNDTRIVFAAIFLILGIVAIILSGCPLHSPPTPQLIPR
jgi:hypothetical protein